MEDWQKEADRFINGLIHVWMQNPSLKPLIKVVREEKRALTAQVASFLRESGSLSKKNDKARSLVIRSALEKFQVEIRMEHFVLFGEADTIELILGSAFETELGIEVDRVIIPHQQKVSEMITRCLFPARDKNLDAKDIVTFLHLFTGRENAMLDQDKTMRYKSMVWFAYLCIALIDADAANGCKEGMSYFKPKLQDLLREAMAGKIINENGGFGYEHGTWEQTLFGWMQGEDSRLFLEKLWSQLNLDNEANHTRVLMPEHRLCIYRQVITLFCPEHA